MKKIKLPKGYMISAFNGPTENIIMDQLPTKFEPIEFNKARIIETAFSIEGMLEQIISHHFFQRHEINEDKSTEFTNQILKSDWCTYSSKRKLVLHIVNDLKLLEGSEKSDYEKLLSKTMKYRNAFTHGQIATDGREFRLSYFENKPQFKTLNDNYFKKIESDLKECWDQTQKVGNLSGAFIIN